MKQAATSLAEELFNQAFEKPRTPRSVAYKAGVLACLKKQLHGIDFAIPFGPGQEAYDAYCAGIDEGWMIVREHRRAPRANVGKKE